MNQLEDDKAFLRSFLDRAAASKVVKVPIAEEGDKSSCTRQESWQNRRDSDAVRQALASPRQPLEQKDGNLFSPAAAPKQEDAPPKAAEPNIADGLILPPIDDLSKKPGRTSPRRSGRTRTTRSMITAPGKERTQISVRVNEGNDTINLTKSEAQVTAIATRRNTRKNKGAALSVPDRLVKWRADVEVLGTTPDPTNPSTKTKRVEWTATICFLDQTAGTQGVEPLIDTSSSPDDDLHAPDSVPSVPPGRSTRTTRSSTPRLRKLRSLGSTASTPAKATLSSTLFPDELAEDMPAPATATPAAAADQKKRAAETAVPSAAAAAVGKAKGAPQQSRIPHSRKRLSLNPSVRSVAAAVREDTLRLFGPGGAAGAVGTAKVQVQVPASLLPVAGGKAAKKTVATRKGDVLS
jgi:hypothetical protein